MGIAWSTIRRKRSRNKGIVSDLYEGDEEMDNFPSGERVVWVMVIVVGVSDERRGEDGRWVCSNEKRRRHKGVSKR